MAKGLEFIYISNIPLFYSFFGNLMVKFTEQKW